MTEQKITPCLWFDFKAEEAVAHYLSIFPSSRILSTARYGETGPAQRGGDDDPVRDRRPAVSGAERRTAIQVHPCMSLMVDCDGQAEIDALWDRLAEGGEHSQCGWLTDKFGVSWQIVPRVLRRSWRRRPANRAGDAGGDADDEARHCTIATGRFAAVNFECG